MHANGRRGKMKLKAGKITLAIILLAVIIFCVNNFKDTLGQYIHGNDSKEMTPQLNEKTGDSGNRNYDYIKKDFSDINIGSLILVNNSAPYNFPEKSDIVSVYNEKNQSYKVSDKTVALHRTAIHYFNKMMLDFEKAKNIDDIIILSGYRTLAHQEKILDKKIQQLGEAEAANWAAQPGCSEHHTGYAMDIGIYKDTGQSQNYTGSGKYSWINENCGNYGFILRYSGYKADITGIADEPWHYRYVGAPHANIIKEKEFCLEEYIDYLRTYDFESGHLEFTDADGGQYEIYFVKASKGVTDIPVPRDNEYSISGNNVDGYVITIKK